MNKHQAENGRQSPHKITEFSCVIADCTLLLGAQIQVVVEVEMVVMVDIEEVEVEEKVVLQVVMGAKVEEYRC